VNILETYRDRLARIVDDGYDVLSQKIRKGRISVDNEASLQLHYSSILKTLGELYEFAKADLFSIELEKNVVVAGGAFVKSRSEKARELVYNTPQPYGEPLILRNSYEFKWDIFDDKYFFMKLEVPGKE
jgi:hypothetical protein